MSSSSRIFCYIFWSRAFWIISVSFFNHKSSQLIGFTIVFFTIDTNLDIDLQSTTNNQLYQIALTATFPSSCNSIQSYSINFDIHHLVLPHYQNNGIPLVLLWLLLRPSQLGPLRRLHQLWWTPLRLLQRREDLRQWQLKPPRPFSVSRPITIPCHGPTQYRANPITQHPEHAHRSTRSYRYSATFSTTAYDANIIFAGTSSYTGPHCNVYLLQVQWWT